MALPESTITLPETVAVMPGGRLPTASTSPVLGLVKVTVTLVRLLSASVSDKSLSAIETALPFSLKVPR